MSIIDESLIKRKMKKLENKVAVVTGASKGIGAAIAKSFAAEGASVVVNYASAKEGAEKVVSDIEKAGGKAIAVQGDVSKADQAQGLIDAAIRKYGRLDVVVNNAGVFDMRPLEAIDEAHYRRLFDVNVLGTLFVTKSAAPHLGEGASVINLSSQVTSFNPPASAIYTATKGAVDSITSVLANELGARKIRVNAISPGTIETEGTHAAGFIGSPFEAHLASQTPLGRTGQPDEVASVAVFLASNDARWLTGDKIEASGGFR
jgi:3-oxoacyl-[acyl-carrier protein] reductase